MKRHRVQRLFWKDRSRFAGCAAGAQGGKTVTAATRFHDQLLEIYNERVREKRTGLLVNAWVVTPTYELATMPQRYLRARWSIGTWSDKRAGIYLQCEPWPGCFVKFRSAEHPDKLVSEPVDLLWLNETARMKPDAWRGGLRMRLNATNGKVIWDTTPMGQNWVYSDLYLPGLREGDRDWNPEAEMKDFRTFVWNTEDNPAVSREEIEQARRTLPPAYFAREYLADFSAFHGQVYPNFSKQCVRPISADDYPEIILGVDWGYAPGHLGVILVMGIDVKRREVGILEEVCAEGQTDDWWASEFVRVRAKYPRTSRVYCDPSAPDKIAFMRKRLWSNDGGRILFREANNAVRDGIMAVAEVIGTGKLAVNVGCPIFVRQHMVYHWLEGTEDRGGDWQEKPAKVDDDTCDSARYGIFSHMTRPSITAR